MLLAHMGMSLAECYHVHWFSLALLVLKVQRKPPFGVESLPLQFVPCLQLHGLPTAASVVPHGSAE